LSQSYFDWDNIQGCGQVLLFLFAQIEHEHCFTVSLTSIISLWCQKINTRATEKQVNNLY